MTEMLLSGEQIEMTALSALRRIETSAEGPDVVATGQVYNVVCTGGVLRVLLDPERLPEGADESLAQAVTSVLRGLPGIERVVVKPRPRVLARRSQLPGVRQILAVHSGKGGVGKSTVAVNLAAAFAAPPPAGRGLRVGLLDGDVYGPSAPLLLGVRGRARPTPDGTRIAPLRAHGVTVMSLGFLMPQGKPLAWRGALVDEGLPQLLREVAWGDLDLLIVDLPSGTSNVHLALAEEVSLAGVVTVTAPSQISIQDVRRGMEMFADLAVPCLGLVENFTGVTCRHCGATRPLFGAGGVEELARETGIPVLARIPFMAEVLSSGESGVPATVKTPDSEAGQAFRALADVLVRRLEEQTVEERP